MAYKATSHHITSHRKLTQSTGHTVKPSGSQPFNHYSDSALTNNPDLSHHADFLNECAASKLARDTQLRNQGSVKHKGDGILVGGMCETGVLAVQPWRDYYLALCTACADEERAWAARERKEAEERVSVRDRQRVGEKEREHDG
ncbi:hypothetical protein CLCR_10974 [Cladophialophora carrionii]|uniref:Uncharacterized protein n=1 Tax=Cladophialophora carrionii TaxID=86049 RepID=A0A1C1CZA0_9EURO|nr:hypothetical protein CLCR_10974 [Cladophialophora carrionii]